MLFIGITLCILFVMILLDALKIVDYVKGIGLVFTAGFYPHAFFFCYLAYHIVWIQKGRLPWVLFLLFMGVCILYWLIRLHIFP
ncbi:MAG: hypothetical protein K2K96_10640, partial [Lachnospiraceae bacterium]|nr:hypothetical protein [Lachnospiraceae bacterium]